MFSPLRRKVKTLSFLKGFIAIRGIETEDIDDTHRSLGRSNESEHIGEG